MRKGVPRVGSVSKRSAAAFQMVNLISQLIDFPDEPFLGEKRGQRLVRFKNTRIHTQIINETSPEIVDFILALLLW